MSDKDIETEPSTIIKPKNIDKLLIYANYIMKMFNEIFQTSVSPSIKTDSDNVSIMLYDMALLYLGYEDDRVMCVLALFDEVSVLHAVELTCMLKDIFKTNLYINGDTYVQNPVSGEMIWGRDDIDTHNEKVWGRKIAHSVIFTDSVAGHS